MTKSYIEFRVYINDDSDMDMVKAGAEDIKANIIDLVNDDNDPKMFDTDVTYEIFEDDK